MLHVKGEHTLHKLSWFCMTVKSFLPLCVPCRAVIFLECFDKPCHALTLFVLLDHAWVRNEVLRGWRRGNQWNIYPVFASLVVVFLQGMPVLQNLKLPVNYPCEDGRISFAVKTTAKLCKHRNSNAKVKRWFMLPLIKNVQLVTCNLIDGNKEAFYMFVVYYLWRYLKAL